MQYVGFYVIAYTATCVSTYDQCVRANKGCQRVTCPSYCQTGDVYGWQIYSSDSSICRAATQAGLLMKNSSKIYLELNCDVGCVMWCGGGVMVGCGVVVWWCHVVVWCGVMVV